MKNPADDKAYHDGRRAFLDGLDYDTNPRRSKDQRDAWTRGYEYERKQALSKTITPEQEAESHAALESLRNLIASL